VTTALYRRYRPETFEEVIGQDHVTGPLMQALRSNRVNHAYLFSGPRGCGKTTSARILARILNCAQNTEATPRATPCGECESCVELGRGGSGSLDVVEIDAASHGGVDDARDLRERATFSPSRDRFKIFILDEAHMVTSAGFNALLKIVEEPPPYLKFIFATTEPEKVIGTIRSRTHHYPFRLVPPEVLQPYLEQLCTQEGVAVGKGVLPLVVRAGGGSVRDSLSILDQLMAGAQGASVDYDMAAGLLGFTPVTLLDDVVEALAASDGASLFGVVDQIISTGHEPRRFVEDLLERLRDLVVIAVSGDRADAVFSSMPEDQLARMRTQAGNLGFAELSRAADIVNAALSEMTGATSPRLHLELLCARLLLPAADDGARGIAARLERLERGGAGLAAGTGPSAAAAPVLADPGAGSPRARATAARATTSSPERPRETHPSSPEQTRQGRPETPAPAARTEADAVTPAATEHAAPASADDADQIAPAAEQRSVEPSAPVPAASQTAAPQTAVPAPTSDMNTAVLRRRWDEVLGTLSNLRKASWALVGGNAQVHQLTDDVLQLAFPSSGLVGTFRNGSHADVVRQAVRETLGFDVRVEGVESDGGGPGVARATGEPSASTLPRQTAPGATDRDAAAASWDLPGSADGAAPHQAAARATAQSGRETHGQTGATDAEGDPAGEVKEATTAVAAEPPLADLPLADLTVADPTVDGSSVETPPPAEPPLDEPPYDEPRYDEPAPDPRPSDRARTPAVPSAQPDARNGSLNDARPAPASRDDLWPEVVPAGAAARESDASSSPASSSPAPVPASSSRPARPASRVAAARQPEPSSAPSPELDQSQPARSLREAAAAAVSRSAARAVEEQAAPRPEFTEEETWDSVDVDDGGNGLIGAPLVAQMLGGTVIDEIVDPEL